MMYGTFLYNCWAALIGFTAYFSLALQRPYAMPLETLGGSFVAALVVFLCTYPARLFLGYVLFTPEDVELVEVGSAEEEQGMKEELNIPGLDRTSTVEFQDADEEEVAKVIRTMMYSEDQTMPNH